MYEAVSPKDEFETHSVGCWKISFENQFVCKSINYMLSYIYCSLDLMLYIWKYDYQGFGFHK